MEKMMQYDPQKRPTASQCLEHDYFKDFVSPVQNSVYGKSKNSFFNKTNEISNVMRKSSGLSKRLESRKSKLESRGINKSKQKNPYKQPSKAPANSYFNNPGKAGLPYVSKNSLSDQKETPIGSGDRNKSVPPVQKGSNKHIGSAYNNDGGILGKYYNNNSQGMAGAQDSTPGSGLTKNAPGSESYGAYGAGGGLSKPISLGGGGLGGLNKGSRKESRGEKPPAYGGQNYGGFGISKYGKKKDQEEEEAHFPSVTNRQALGSGASIGSRKNITSGIESKEGSRTRVPQGGLGGFGGVKNYGSDKKESTEALPNLNKYSNAGGLGSMNKGGLNLGGGLSKGGGLGRYNL